MRELSGAAIVSGGASGLGAATATALHAAGLAVLVADVDEEHGVDVAARLGEHASFRRVDVTDPAAVEAAVAEAAALDEAGLRLSVACAGVGTAERLLGRTGPHAVEVFRRVLEVNLFGTFHLLRAAAAAMAANEPVEGERGVHVQTASAAAFEGQIGQVAYAASKAAIAGMTLPAARDLAGRGIRVCSIVPGTFDTPMLAGLPDEVRESIAATVPFPPRLGRPEEFADLVVSIAGNGMINGETVRIDGALRMAPR
jgi:NAD(P)-dependent dehydrogenase (short-subunit alcohol dehydrogenase family)